jgi:DNA transformation protein and related proteins
MSTPLIKLPNIGKKTEQHLNEVGIYSKEDLEKVGALNAWRKIKGNYPYKDICICALYALIGAIEGICWYELPEDLKNIYKKQI